MCDGLVAIDCIVLIILEKERKVKSRPTTNILATLSASYIY